MHAGQASNASLHGANDSLMPELIWPAAAHLPPLASNVGFETLALGVPCLGRLLPGLRSGLQGCPRAVRVSPCWRLMPCPRVLTGQPGCTGGLGAERWGVYWAGLGVAHAPVCLCALHAAPLECCCSLHQQDA